MLVFIFLILIATIEWKLSAKNVMKIDFRNKMEYEFLTDFMILFIERDITATISANSIIDDFKKI